MTSWRDRISVDPNVCNGKPCIKGTRVMLSVVLDNLAAGECHEEIMRGYHIEKEDIQAALHYAADLARDPVVTLPAAGWLGRERSLRSDAPSGAVHVT